ncbi:MAG: DUF3859 domain-containing protein [Rhodobacteraceae bacterium]|jgi:hypothetical protein|nr:DUF3859 domain-containing protein [Paracoccaceae bacterium]
MRALILPVILAVTPALADPGPPFAASVVAQLDWGIFCSGEAMDRAAAPDTDSGFIHVPRRSLSFHWPGVRRVPAALGLAFGVEAMAQPGMVQPVEIRVFHPDRPLPERWDSTLSDTAASLVFFRFDRADELTPGIWAIEAHDGADDGASLLYRVEFEIVPAEALPEMVHACEATA